MAYKKPKNQLHREFLYLNTETVFNSLSAIEKGAVDEIIETATEAREAALNAGLKAGPVSGGGKRGTTRSVEEELTRKRTNFSAFEAWYRALEKEDAFGEFEGWDQETRDQMSVGDTVKFTANVRLSPVQQVMVSFLGMADSAGKPGAFVQVATADVAKYKKTGAIVRSLMGRAGGESNYLVYLEPGAVEVPRIAARLDEKYLVTPLEGLSGQCTIIAQVSALITPTDPVPVFRVMGDSPPTPKEIEAVEEAFFGILPVAASLGVEAEAADLTLRSPGVIVHPIAIYR